MADELKFFTSQELVAELISRTTFVGLVIHSTNEAKQTSRHKNFELNFSPNLCLEQVVQIMDSFVELYNRPKLG